ncbi:hypothetical protein BD408DRAFT_447085 [Parasitella parasitica]|nr:hypothetical protein BD408DRAFT_447085 [Parasitella parasitica]
MGVVQQSYSRGFNWATFSFLLCALPSLGSVDSAADELAGPRIDIYPLDNEAAFPQSNEIAIDFTFPASKTQSTFKMSVSKRSAGQKAIEYPTPTDQKPGFVTKSIKTPAASAPDILYAGIKSLLLTNATDVILIDIR